LSAPKITTYRTIAGTFFYPTPGKGETVTHALMRDPYSGRMTLVTKPFEPGGLFISIDNDEYRHAVSDRHAKALAVRFFTPQETS
jgi:hypothetical protein